MECAFRIGSNDARREFSVPDFQIGIGYRFAL